MRGYKNEQRENITVGINHNTGDVSYPVHDYGRLAKSSVLACGGGFEYSSNILAVGGGKMKLKYILQFCKKNKYLSLMKYGDKKYLSAGEVTALVQGISPQWEIKDYFAAMGIDEGSRENYAAFEDIDGEDINVDELDKLSALPFTIGTGGDTYKLFTRTDGRIMVLNTQYITVFRDEFAIEYYSRGALDYIFVVSRGICVGIITATSLNMQQLTEFAGIIREGFHHNFKTNFLDNGGQIEITD